MNVKYIYFFNQIKRILLDFLMAKLFYLKGCLVSTYIACDGFKNYPQLSKKEQFSRLIFCVS